MNTLGCRILFLLITISSTWAQYGRYLYNPAMGRSYYTSQCPSGFAKYNGACIPIQYIQAKPGQPCHALTECTGGAVCIGGICRCLPGLFPSQGVCILPPRFFYG